MAESGNTRIVNWIVGLLSAGIVGGFGYGFVSMNNAIGEANKTGGALNANVMVLTTQVSALKDSLDDRTKDRYTGSDAAKDRQALLQLIVNNQQEIKEMREQVRRLQLDEAERKGRTEAWSPFDSTVTNRKE